MQFIGNSIFFKIKINIMFSNILLVFILFVNGSFEEELGNNKLKLVSRETQIYDKQDFSHEEKINKVNKLLNNSGNAVLDVELG